MKKILFILFLLLPIVAFGQRFPYSNSAHLGGNPEMITNGVFADSTGWVINDAGNPIENGVFNFGGGYGVDLKQGENDIAIQITTSTNYRLKFTVGASSGDGPNITIKDNYNTETYVANTSYLDGEHTCDFTTPSTLSANCYGIKLYFLGDASCTIDNISLKKR